MPEVAQLDPLTPKRKDKKTDAEQFNEAAGAAQTIYSIYSKVGDSGSEAGSNNMAGESSKDVSNLASNKKPKTDAMASINAAKRRSVIEV